MRTKRELGTKQHGFLVVAMFAFIALSACQKGQCPPLPPPEPTRVVLDIRTFEDINPNDQGRPSPLVLRIYQLRSEKEFSEAYFQDLFQNDQNVLKGVMIGREEIIVVPNEKRAVFYEPDKETQAIGILAAFRHFQLGEWRCITRVAPNEFGRFFVTIRGNRIDIK